MSSGVSVVIPTKSNVAGLMDVMGDVLADGSVRSVFVVIDGDPTIGLICPTYAEVALPADRDVVDTCRSRYDGTGGMAGFAMMLHQNLARSWTFDENLRWWYGDDDIVRWITRTMNRRAVISASARCRHLDSVTIHSDPPTDFGRLVEQDRAYFESKWAP